MIHWLADFFGQNDSGGTAGEVHDAFSCSMMDEDCIVNPATGLMMTGGIGGVDAAGNPYGSDCCDAGGFIGSGFGMSSFDDLYDPFNSNLSGGFGDDL